MSLPSRSPHSSRHNSFSNLFGLSSKHQDNEVAIIERSDRHEDAQLHDLVPVTERPIDHQHDNDYVPDEYEDEYDEQTKSATFTQNHPMGRILLDLTTDEGKSKNKNKNMNVDKLCHNFYEAMQIESLNRERQFKQMMKQVEENLLQKELTSHTISMDIRPPTCFSPRNVLNTMALKNDCLRLFPTRNKFGSTAKDHTMDVVEFLYAMNSAHESCKISKEEFRKMLLACTTGKPHSLIRGWITSGYDINTIYHYLQVHFDTRLSAQEASSQLKTYKAPKSANLAKVQAHLMELASRACSQIPEGPSRTALFDLELNQSLIRSLPTESQHLVQTKFNELSARQGRAATAAELSQALHSIRHVVDQDIKKNGGDRQDKAHHKYGKSNISNKRFERKPTTFLIDSSFKEQYTADYDNASLKSEDFDEDEEEYYKTRPMVIRRHNIGTFHTASAEKNTSRTNPKYRDAPNRNHGPKMNGSNRRPSYSSNKPYNGDKRHMNNKSNTGYKTSIPYCSLCGRKNHMAAHGCPNMVDDNGKIVVVLPTHSTCTDCPQKVHPRLNHPVPLCPYRNTGPFKHLA